MIWKIDIRQNRRLRDLFYRHAFGPVNQKKYIQILTRFLVTLTKEHVTRNQYRFNKTRKNLGVSLVHQNYVAKNVRPFFPRYPYCQLDIRIKGIQRNFRPLVIVPKHSKYLTIPVSKVSFQKSARQFSGLFKPKGKNVLARKKGKSLEILYALTRQAYQPMTRGMLPDERQILNRAYYQLSKYINEEENSINNM
jgi:hypothetical protein